MGYYTNFQGKGQEANTLRARLVGLTLWDIEDQQLVEVVERFRQDLTRREQSLG